MPGSGPRRRVLVVGVDGVRLDLLPAAATPHLDAVAAAGFLGPIEIDEATPTMSGPCWATIVTGVGVARHGVYGNHFGGHRLDVFPDFATRLAREDGRRTFVAGGWDPLLLARDGGPLFAAPAGSRTSRRAPTPARTGSTATTRSPPRPSTSCGPMTRRPPSSTSARWTRPATCAAAAPSTYGPSSGRTNASACCSPRSAPGPRTRGRPGR